MLHSKLTGYAILAIVALAVSFHARDATAGNKRLVLVLCFS